MTILNQLSGKLKIPTKEEKWLQLQKPLLDEFESPNEELLTLLKDYLVYIVNKQDRIIYCGFLATRNEILVPDMSFALADNCFVKIGNRLTGMLDVHRFRIERNGLAVITAKVNISK